MLYAWATITFHSIEHTYYFRINTTTIDWGELLSEFHRANDKRTLVMEIWCKQTPCQVSRINEHGKLVRGERRELDYKQQLEH